MFATLALLTLSACTRDPSFATLCNAEHDGQEITLTGKLDVASVTVDMGSGLMMIFNDAYSDETMVVELREGQDVNQVAPLPERFTADQVQIKMADGQTVGLKEPVQLTGTAKVSSLMGEESCKLRKISKVSKP